jgi:hypothetical protein
MIQIGDRVRVPDGRIGWVSHFTESGFLVHIGGGAYHYHASDLEVLK